MRVEPGLVKTGFQLGDGIVVACRQLADGWWEAWVVDPTAGTGLKRSCGTPYFCGPTRFKAQCKVARWHAERQASLTACA